MRRKMRGKQRENSAEHVLNMKQGKTQSLQGYDSFYRWHRIIGLELIPASRAGGVREQPLVNAGDMEPMVASGKHPYLLPISKLRQANSTA